MRRVPLRARLAAVSALVIAVVLALACAYAYAQVRGDLDESLDNGLRARADDVARLVRDRPSRIRLLADREETFTQLIDARGAVIAGPRAPVLRPAEVARARRDVLFVDHRAVAGIEGRARVVARPAPRGIVVVVGASTDDRDETLAGLLRAFAIGGPLVVLAAGGLGFLLATAASRAALDRLRAALDRERAFVSDASHELRTPLAVLKAELEVAADPRRSEPDLRAAVRSAGDEVDRLAQLAEDLLVIARTQHDGLPVSRERAAVGAVLESARARFGRRADQAGRTLVVDAPAALHASLDPLRIEQAVGNLIDNALRHGMGDVVITAAQASGAVQISVADEGPGMPPDLAEHAFERFTRGDRARGRGGTGLGLAIVHAIAAAHGGQAVLLESRRRTVVAIRLPSSSPHPTAVRSASSSKRVPGGTS